MPKYAIRRFSFHEHDFGPKTVLWAVVSLKSNGEVKERLSAHTSKSKAADALAERQEKKTRRHRIAGK